MSKNYTRNATFQDAAGPFFKEHDPHHRPVCTFAGTTGDAVWPDQPWVDLAINHTCTPSTRMRIGFHCPGGFVTSFDGANRSQHPPVSFGGSFLG